MLSLFQNPYAFSDYYDNPAAIYMAVRRALYRSNILKVRKLPIPVVGVGKLSRTHIGNSTIAAQIAHLIQLSCQTRVALIIPGKEKSIPAVISDGTSIRAIDKENANGVIAAMQLPGVIIIQGANCFQNAQAAIELGAEVLIVDDAYQNHRLRKDLNVLVVSVSEKNEAIVPIGKLRESVRASQDADVILIVGSPQNEIAEYQRFIAQRWPLKSSTLITSAVLQCKRIEYPPFRTVAERELHGRKILAVSSIDSPERFRKLLESLGAEVIECILAKGFDVSVADNIRDVATRTNCHAIVLTTKDAELTKPHFDNTPIPVWVLSIEYHWENVNALQKRLGAIPELNPTPARTVPGRSADTSARMSSRDL